MRGNDKVLEHLSLAIRAAGEAGDNASCALFEEILADEMGIQNYVASSFIKGTKTRRIEDEKD